jgi:hypothetical protein
MKHIGLINGLDVRYVEHTNRWILEDSAGKTLSEAGSLKELRDWEEQQRRKEEKVPFVRRSAIHYNQHGYDFGGVPVAVSVTSQDSGGEFWVSYSKPGEARARRSRVPAKFLFDHTPENLQMVAASAEDRKAGEALILAAANRLKSLHPFKV